MKITSVNVHKKDYNNKMKGIASVVLDDCFVVRDIRILEREDGLSIAMPSRKRSNGEYRDVAHPINTETRELFNDVILTEYEKQVKQASE